MEQDASSPLPEQITLPSGGAVWFRDLDDVGGKDWKDIRTAYNQMIATGESRQAYEVAAAVLITKWEIPGRPNLPLPGSPEGNTGKVTDLLGWRDCRALDTELGKAILYMRMGVTDGDPLPGAAG